MCIVARQIGVITPYEGQRAYVVNHMARNGPLRQQLYKDIEVREMEREGTGGGREGESMGTHMRRGTDGGTRINYLDMIERIRVPLHDSVQVRQPLTEPSRVHLLL